jgi:S1-C subfamily serine protease
MEMASVKKAIVGIVGRNNSIPGTGFFLGPDGYVITCYHVIDNLTNIKIRINNQIDKEAVLDKEKSVKHCDIAVLKINEPSPDFLNPALDYEDNEEVFSIMVQTSKIYSLRATVTYLDHQPVSPLQMVKHIV